MKTTGRNLVSLIGTAMLATTLTATVLPAFAQDVITLRMHQFLPVQANIPNNTLQKWADEVEAASNGRIQVEHYGSMALGGTPPELYDQAVDGVADIIWTLPGYTPGRFPEAEVFELPFMMNNPEAASKAFWELAQDTLINDEMSDTHVLGLWVHGPGVIHSKDPIRTVGDLAGLKLRTPTRTTNMLFRNLGAEPISMPVPAVPENLAKGVIDATVIPWEVTGSLKVPELVSNHTEFQGTPLYTATFIFTMNKDRYESLPDDLKAVIDAASGLEFSGAAGRQLVTDDAIARQNAADMGNTIIEVSQEESQAWHAASEATIEQWITEMNDKGIDGAALIARAKELMEKYDQ